MLITKNKSVLVGIPFLPFSHALCASHMPQIPFPLSFKCLQCRLDQYMSWKFSAKPMYIIMQAVAMYSVCLHYVTLASYSCSA